MRKKNENSLDLTNVEINGYKLTEEISRTNHSYVYKAESLSDNHLRCFKFIERDRKSETAAAPQLFKTESNALTILNHSSIVKVYDYLVSEHFFVLIMDYMNGGDLNTILSKRQFLDNQQIQQIIYTLILGIQYSHIRNVAHHCIKPSNILFNNHKAALSDFGIEVLRKKGEKKDLNSLSYTAPELLEQNDNADDFSENDKPADIWSIGVILFQMLNGKPPWNSTNYKDLVNQIKKGVYTFSPKVPPLARDLITRMLDADPFHRITCHEILAHPWLSKVKSSIIRSKHGKFFLTHSMHDFGLRPSLIPNDSQSEDKSRQNRSIVTHVSTFS